MKQAAAPKMVRRYFSRYMKPRIIMNQEVISESCSEMGEQISSGNVETAADAAADAAVNASTVVRLLSNTSIV